MKAGVGCHGQHIHDDDLPIIGSKASDGGLAVEFVLKVMGNLLHMQSHPRHKVNAEAPLDMVQHRHSGIHPGESLGVPQEGVVDVPYTPLIIEEFSAAASTNIVLRGDISSLIVEHPALFL